MIKKNYILSIGVIVFSLFFLYETTQIQEIGSSFIISSITWPLILLIGLLVLGVYMLVRTYVQSRKLTEGEPVVIEGIEEDAEAEEESEEEIRRLYNIPMSNVTIVLLAIYFGLISQIGFIVSTLIFVPIFSYLLGNRKIVTGLILGIAITALFIFVFPQLLSVPLPRGIGVFRELSFLFY